MAKQSKMKNKKVIIDGIKFDSTVEGEYYEYLMLQESMGKIKKFRLQPVYILQEKFKHPRDGHIQAITLRADFVVTDNRGNAYVVDVKGQPTPDAKIKRKMFLNKFDLPLLWISKSKKWGTDGWIDYFELEKIRRDNRKEKKKNLEEKAKL